MNQQIVEHKKMTERDKEKSQRKTVVNIKKGKIIKCDKVT